MGPWVQQDINDSRETGNLGYVYTGDPSPSSLVYDAARNRILVTNLQYNEIDVISPETMTVTERLPVPQPMAIDLSADSKTLIIGTRTHYFYRATADALCITDRHYLSNSTALSSNLSPMYPTALADGSILFGAFSPYYTGSALYRWTDSGGFTQIVGGFLDYSVRNIIPSGDRTHAYISEDDSGGGYARYDVGGTLLVQTVAFGTQPWVLAVSQDGSRALILEDCCGVVLVDSSFSSIASSKIIYIAGAIAEPDFSRFYFSGITSNFVTVTDGNLKPIGSLPQPIVEDPGSRLQFRAFDGKHRILSLVNNGVALISTAHLNPALASGASVPFFSTSGANFGAATPSNPQNGFSTQLNGAYFASTPTVTFNDAGVIQPATNVAALSINVIAATAPSFPLGCADITAAFSNGNVAYAPQAYCYAPSIYVVDGDSGPTSGGSTLTLYGIGFGSKPPTVTIGGVASTQVTLNPSYASSVSLALSKLQVLLPPGTLGSADITITTCFGSTTLSKAFQYVQRNDSALPSGAQPIQLLLDSARSRVLITDSAHNQLLVYGYPSLSLLQSVPTGPAPQSISLTPDNTRLLILTAGDYKLSVLDAGTYATQQRVTLPSTAQSVFGTGPAGPGVEVAAMAGNKAYIVTQAGYLQGGAGPYSSASFSTTISLQTRSHQIR